MRNVRLFLLLWLGLAAQVAFAQPQPCGPNPEMTSFCDEACIICDINGFTGINDDPAEGQAPPGFCTNTVHHMQWIGFIAGSTNLTLNVRVFNCNLGDGLEVGIYKSLDCETFQLVSNCDGDVQEGETGVFTNTVPLTVGQYYFFVMDGNHGDVCRYTIEVVSGTTAVSELPNSGLLDGDFTVCPGRTEAYVSFAPKGAAWFSWTLDGVQHSAGPDSVTTVNWTTPGQHTLCVTASNVCDTAPATCQIISVQAIPPTLITATLCEGECWTGADTVLCTAGMREFHFAGHENCDSVVIVDIEVLPNAFYEFEQTICDGDSIVVGGQAYSSPGQYQKIIPATNGCDSTITFGLEVLPNSSSDLHLMICEGDTVVVGGKAFFSAGQFQHIIASKNGCDSTINLDLQLIICEIQGRIATDPVDCNGAPTGALRFSVLDATPPLHYVWERIGHGFPTGTGNLNLLNSEVTIPGLPQGTYFITITDDFGNDAVLFADVAEPLPLTGQTLASDFKGFNISCAGLSDGRLQLVPSGGTPPYRFRWSSGDSTAIAQNLPPGTYTVTLTDRNDCTTTTSHTLNEPPPLTLEVASEDPNCTALNSGAARVTAFGGGVPGYEFQITGRNWGRDTVFQDLFGGDYEIALRDTNGCTQTAEVKLLPVFIPQIELGPDKTIELGEDVRLNWPQLWPLDTFVWSPEPGLSCYDCPHPTAAPFRETTWTLFVESEAGCQDLDTITVHVLDKRDVYFPNIFSPKDDNGRNDFFTVFGGPEVLTIKSLEVYSRWGELVFRRENFAPNTEQTGWDGTFRGKNAPTGVYVWLAAVEFVDGVVLRYEGNLTLIR